MDFVGASVTELGHKPQLSRAVVKSAISGTNGTLPAEQRDRVKHMLAASGATLTIRIYSDVAAAMSPRTAPIFVTLSDAAQTDTDCAALFTKITDRHAANMLKLTADPRSTGELRAELSDQYVAGVVGCVPVSGVVSPVLSVGSST